MRCRFYAYEESQVGRSKKRKEDGCFPIIQHHRPCFQVLQITENQLRKVEARLLPLSTSVFLVLLCTCSSFSSIYTYLVAHYTGPFRNYGRRWLHRRGAESFNDFSISVSRRWTWTSRNNLSKRSFSLSRSFPGYHFPIIHNSIIRSWLIDLIGRRDLKRALYIAAC